MTRSVTTPLIGVTGCRPSSVSTPPLRARSTSARLLASDSIVAKMASIRGCPPPHRRRHRLAHRWGRHARSSAGMVPGEPHRMTRIVDRCRRREPSSRRADTPPTSWWIGTVRLGDERSGIERVETRPTRVRTVFPSHCRAEAGGRLPLPRRAVGSDRRVRQ